MNSTKPLSKDLVVEVHFFILVITTNDNDIILITFIVDIMVVMASIVQLVPYRRGVHFRILAQTGPRGMDGASGFGTDGGLKYRVY